MLFVRRWWLRPRVVAPVAALLTVAAVAGAAVALRSDRATRLDATGPDLPETPSLSESASPTPSASPTASPSTGGPTTPPATATPAVKPAVVKVRCGPKDLPDNPYNDGTITGVVTDSADHPLRGVRLGGGGSCGMRAAVTGLNLTGADGRYAVPCLTTERESGRWWATPPGFAYDGGATGLAYGFAWVGSGAGAPVRCGSTQRVVLLAPGTVHGQLVDRQGRPVAGSVSFGLYAGDSEGGIELWSVATDKATGRLTFAGLAPGRYFLWSSNGGLPGDRSTEVSGGFSVTAGGTTTIRLLLPSAASASPTSTPVS